MESKGMTYAINKLAQPKGFTREQAQLVTQAMEHVEQDIDESLTQQEIFNRLTDNGAAQGLLLYNGQLYINASYINAGYLNADHIQGGTLTLGGQGNQNGVLQVLDASGNVITVLNNAGADITNGSLTTYSTDRQTRTILSDGLLKFQFYNSAAQPIGWRDALRLAADSQSATIGTFAGIAELNISGRGRVKLKNNEGTTDPDYAEIDMDDDSVLLTATRNYSGLLVWTSLQVTKDGVTVSKKGTIGDPYVLFELAAGQSSKPLSVGNGGTGATTPDGACANIGAVKKGSFTSTLLYQGTPAVNAAFTLSDYVGNYNILRIVDTDHYYCDVYMPVHTSTQTIMANGSTSFPYDGTPRFLLWEFTATSSDGINYTVARKAQTNITSTGVEFITTNADFGIQIYGLR
jgi:hypothetical protein